MNSLYIPIKNIFNQQYAADISKKTKSVLKEKRARGINVSPFSPYGYIKDKDNNNKLIIDAEVASVVRRIFDLVCEGYGTKYIAKVLTEENILCPKGRKYKIVKNRVTD